MTSSGLSIEMVEGDAPIPARPSDEAIALIRRHRMACFTFARCEPSEHSNAARELMNATELLEAALAAAEIGRTK